MGYLPEEEAAEDANALAKLKAFRGEAAVRVAFVSFALLAIVLYDMILPVV